MAYRRVQLKAEINLVPYIDVVLVLLVIFMMVAPLAPTTQIPLPKGSADALPADYLQIELSKTNQVLQYRVVLMEGQQQKVLGQFSTLQTALSTLHKQPANRTILIAAAGDLPYEEVITVLTNIKQRGWGRVGLATR